MSQRRSAPQRYIVLHKPRGVLCEWTDPEGRGCPTLPDLLPLRPGARWPPRL